MENNTAGHINRAEEETLGRWPTLRCMPFIIRMLDTKIQRITPNLCRGFISGQKKCLMYSEVSLVNFVKEKLKNALGRKHHRIKKHLKFYSQELNSELMKYSKYT